MGIRSILDRLKCRADTCQLCKLYTTRTQIVFGIGNADSKIMIIGEAPGKDEDLQGVPFIGKAGQELNKMLEQAGIKREEVYITNIVKCRPTINLQFQKDRPPDEEEKESCKQYLQKQIEIINPQVIISLGNPSTQFLLKTNLGITKIRGQWSNYKGISLLPTYHPSYVSRNGGEGSSYFNQVVEDFKKVNYKLISY